MYKGKPTERGFTSQQDNDPQTEPDPDRDSFDEKKRKKVNVRTGQVFSHTSVQ